MLDLFHIFIDYFHKINILDLTFRT